MIRSKKILSKLMISGVICSLLFTVFNVSLLKAEDSNILYGDVDNSGSVDSDDYSLIKMYLLGKITLDKLNKTAADVNCDGEINYADVRTIREYILESIDKLPAAAESNILVASDTHERIVPLINLIVRCRPITLDHFHYEYAPIRILHFYIYLTHL